MRKLHPVIVIFLAVLFAVQTVAAMSAQCAELHRHKVQPCCACCEALQVDDGGGQCNCYQAPDQPPTTPVVQTHTTLLTATVSPNAAPTIPSGTERLQVAEVSPAPAPPFLRDADVRAPPLPR